MTIAKVRGSDSHALKVGWGERTGRSMQSCCGPDAALGTLYLLSC